MEELLYFLLDVFIGGLALRIAAHFSEVDLDLKETLLSAAAAAVAGLVPEVGWVLSILVLFYVLRKFSGGAGVSDLLFLVVFSRLIAIVSILGIGGLL